MNKVNIQVLILFVITIVVFYQYELGVTSLHEAPEAQHPLEALNPAELLSLRASVVQTNPFGSRDADLPIPVKAPPPAKLPDKEPAQNPIPAPHIPPVTQVPVSVPVPVPVPVPAPHIPPVTQVPVSVPVAKPSNELSFEVTMPDKLQKCVRAQIDFTPSEDLSVEQLEQFRSTLTVELECSAEADANDIESDAITVAFNKILYSSIDVPGKKIIAYFYPDDSTSRCNVVAKSTRSPLTGTPEAEYEVGRIPANRYGCWHCFRFLYRGTPLASDFHLELGGKKLWNTDTPISLESGQTLDLYIVALPEVLEKFPDLVKHALFNAWIESTKLRQGFQVDLLYNEEHKGYRVVLEGWDGGEFTLRVTMNWFYPLSDLLGDPMPILTSSHIRHELNHCDRERSEIFTSGIKVAVKRNGLDLILPTSPKKCLTADAKGRWLNVIPHDQPCQLPYCTGDKLESFVSHMSWQGTRNDWLWVPFDCHYHYFTQEDFGYCARQQNIKWIHVMGDSLSREFVGYLMSVMGEPDTHKFESADQILNTTGVRITFQSWQDLLMAGPETEGPENYRKPEFLKTLLDHYNLLAPDTSTTISLPRVHLDIDIVETDAPDVFLHNPATSYALYRQTYQAFARYLEDLGNVVGDVFIKGRSDGHKTRAYWYSNPYIFGAAHAGTEFITQGRNAVFAKMAKDKVGEYGFRYFDSFPITQPRWEESWDGLHFLNGYREWRGHTAATFIQAWLNELLGECTGPSP